MLIHLKAMASISTSALTCTPRLVHCRPFECTTRSRASVSGRDPSVAPLRGKVLHCFQYNLRRSEKRKLQRRLRVSMQESGGDKGNEAREDKNSTESLFMRELRRRGLSDTAASKSSAPADEKRVPLSQEAIRAKVQGLEPPPIGGGGVGSAEEQKQIDKSRALASEGLDGLPVRAAELLKLGSGFFLGFGPLILLFFIIFAAASLYFGEGFLHPGSKYTGSRPTYIDPYDLLKDDYMYQYEPPRKPMVEF